MRIKRAFSLVELIVVVVLIGSMFGLVVGFISKSNNSLEQQFSITSLPNYIAKNYKERALDFLVFGQKCNKIAVIDENGKFLKFSQLNSSSKFELFERDNEGYFIQKMYKKQNFNHTLEKVCIKISFNNGKFIDKVYVKYKEKFYLFDVFFQKILEFANKEELDRYLNVNLGSLESFYRE